MSSSTPANKIITVFGSSRPQEGDSHYLIAQELGAQLGRRGFTVCSGGYGGVMEAVSRGAKDAGARTLGITTEFFSAHANAWIDEVISVQTWQERLLHLSNAPPATWRVPAAQALSSNSPSFGKCSINA